MSLKLLGAALASLISTSAAPAIPAIPDEPIIEYRAIVKLDCGTGSGTAFWVGETRLISAQHVTRNGDCSINGVPVTKVREDEALQRGARPQDPLA